MSSGSDLLKFYQPTCIDSHAACGGNIDLSHNSLSYYLPTDGFLSQIKAITRLKFKLIADDDTVSVL